MRILVCAFVCAAGLLAGAQPLRAQEVSVGVKVGVTSATLSVTGLGGFDPQRGTGVLAGGFVSVGGKMVRVQPEVFVTTRNFSAASAIGQIDVASRTVDVPVLFVARLRQDGRVHPMLLAGPFLSVISKSTQTVDGVETDIKPQLTDTDMGAVFGLGMEIAAPRGALVVDVRYALGFKDLSVSSETTFKSRTLMASFGYRF